MKLSVVIPMYNAEKYIGKCLESILNQKLNHEEYEIIVVNDGSSDNSLNVVVEKSNQYKNIRVFTVPNGGQGKARNYGVVQAKGKYIYFVDADDYIAFNSLHKCLEEAEIEEDLDMLFFNIRVTDREDEFESLPQYDSKSSKVYDGITYFSENILNNSPCHFFIRKKFIEENNLKFVEGRYLEDGLFLVDCIIKAKKVKFCNVDVYRYVHRPGSTTRNKSLSHKIKMIQDFYLAVEHLNNIYIKSQKENLPKNFLTRLETRRDSYTFFMQIRMIKARVGYKFAKQVIEKLENINCYKYKRFRGDYHGLKLTILWYLLNRKWLFILLCGLNGKNAKAILNKLG